MGAAMGVAVLAGCESYPPAEEVAACATARFGTEHGSFSVTQRPGSLLSGTEYNIIYQKDGSPDFATLGFERVTSEKNGHPRYHPPTILSIYVCS